MLHLRIQLVALVDIGFHLPNLSLIGAGLLIILLHFVIGRIDRLQRIIVQFLQFGIGRFTLGQAFPAVFLIFCRLILPGLEVGQVIADRIEVSFDNIVVLTGLIQRRLRLIHFCLCAVLGVPCSLPCLFCILRLLLRRCQTFPVCLELRLDILNSLLGCGNLFGHLVVFALGIGFDILGLFDTIIDLFDLIVYPGQRFAVGQRLVRSLSLGNGRHKCLTCLIQCRLFLGHSLLLWRFSIPLFVGCILLSICLRQLCLSFLLILLSPFQCLIPGRKCLIGSFLGLFGFIHIILRTRLGIFDFCFDLLFGLLERFFCFFDIPSSILDGLLGIPNILLSILDGLFGIRNCLLCSSLFSLRLLQSLLSGSQITLRGFHGLSLSRIQLFFCFSHILLGQLNQLLDLLQFLLRIGNCLFLFLFLLLQGRLQNGVCLLHCAGQGGQFLLQLGDPHLCLFQHLPCVLLSLLHLLQILLRLLSLGSSGSLQFFFGLRHQFFRCSNGHIFRFQRLLCLLQLLLSLFRSFFLCFQIRLPLFQLFFLLFQRCLEILQLRFPVGRSLFCFFICFLRLCHCFRSQTVILIFIGDSSVRRLSSFGGPLDLISQAAPFFRILLLLEFQIPLGLLIGLLGIPLGLLIGLLGVPHSLPGVFLFCAGLVCGRLCLLEILHRLGQCRLHGLLSLLRLGQLILQIRQIGICRILLLLQRSLLAQQSLVRLDLLCQCILGLAHLPLLALRLLAGKSGRLFLIPVISLIQLFPGLRQFLFQRLGIRKLRLQLLQRLFQRLDQLLRIIGLILGISLSFGLLGLLIELLAALLEVLGRLIGASRLTGRGRAFAEHIVAHFAPGDVHAEHLPVSDGGGLYQQSGLIGHQIAITFLHHRTAGEHISPGHYAGDKLVVGAANKQQHRQHQICTQRQRIHIIHADIALHFQREGFGYGLAPHMNIVVQTAFLDVVILQFAGKCPHTLAGQVKHHLHAQHKIEIYQRIFSLVPYDPILITDAGHGHAPPCRLFSAKFQNTLLFFLRFLGGIQTAVDGGYLLAPAAAAGMIQRHNLLRTPMEIIGDEAHLPVEFIFGVQRYPSRVKFMGTSWILPQSGQTTFMVGGSTLLIRWYISCRNARSAVKKRSTVLGTTASRPSSSVITAARITMVR